MIAHVSRSEDFVAAAYRYILMRPVDPTGRQLYTRLIENRQLSRWDLLKELADSDEAKERSTKLVIIPEPSSWLGIIQEGQVVPYVVVHDR